MPGSPSTPSHPPMRRIAYFLVGALVVMTYALSKGFVTVNLPQIPGELSSQKGIPVSGV